MQEVYLLASFSLGKNNYCVCACQSVNFVQEQLKAICMFRLLKVNNKKHMTKGSFVKCIYHFENRPLWGENAF